MSATPALGTVALVGAGPGDPGLLTVRGLRLLQLAEVVLHDRLVSAEIQALIPPEAECIEVGKTGGRPERSALQSRIQELLLEHARAGRRVVRLKGGDPYVFGRGFEEIEALHEAGIPVEVVPGVTSALAGPAAAGIPVTHREVARSLSVTTLARAKDQESNELGGAAADTICVLMTLRRLGELRDELLAKGRSPTTPAALIEHATLPDQRVARTTLQDLPETAAREQLGSPTMVVVGEVAALQPPAGPLAGRHVLITRPREPARPLRARLEARAAAVDWQPLIEPHVLDSALWSEPPPASAFGERWEWVVFCSLHGVRGFFHELERRELDVRALGGCRVAAVGPKTEEELERFGVRTDLVPRTARTHALARALADAVPSGTRILFSRGTLSREALPRALREAGLEVDTVDVYDTATRHLSPRAAAQVAAGAYDAVLLHSPSAARSLAVSLTAHGALLPPRQLVACVGAATGRAAQEHLPDAEILLPDDGAYGDEALLDAIEGRLAGAT